MILYRIIINTINIIPKISHVGIIVIRTRYATTTVVTTTGIIESIRNRPYINGWTDDL